MKMMYGNVPVKSMNVHSYEMDTNDATLRASDMQAGVTAYAKGKKVVGTGKCFEFASYGSIPSNKSIPIPCLINTILVSSTEYPVQSSFVMDNISKVDFSVEETIATIAIDGNLNPVTVKVANNILTISCNEDITLEYFMGKDAYL